MNRKVIKVIQKDDSPMSLTWVINNFCNNRCSYCTPQLHNGTGDHYSWENAEKFLDKLFEKYPKIHCSISGGEPSLSPFLPELVKKFNVSGNTIGTTSNAFKPIEYWEDISKYLYYICFSYHPEFPVKDFKEKVIVSSFNTFVTVRVMMFPSMWDHCVEVFNSLKDIPTINIEPVRILDWNGKDRKAHLYTEDQLDWFKNNEGGHQKILTHLIEKKEPAQLQGSFQFDDGAILSGKDVDALELINSGMANFDGYICEIGLKSLFVAYDGRIKRGNCLVGEPIGEIEDFENIKWPTDPVVCNQTLCECATDVNISKWMPNYDEYIQDGVYNYSYLNQLK